MIKTGCARALQDMVDHVSKVANDGRDERNRQARRVMGKLIHKFTDKSQTYEFQGGIRDILNAKKDPSKKLLFERARYQNKSKNQIIVDLIELGLKKSP